MNFSYNKSKKEVLTLLLSIFSFFCYSQNTRIQNPLGGGYMGKLGSEPIPHREITKSKNAFIIASNYDGKKPANYYKEWIFFRSGKTSSDLLEGPLDWLYDSQLAVGDDRIIARRKLEFRIPRTGPNNTYFGHDFNAGAGQYIMNSWMANHQLPYGLSLFSDKKERIRLNADYVSLMHSDKSQLTVRENKVGINGTLYFNENDSDIDSHSSTYITNTKNKSNKDYPYSEEGISFFQNDQEKMRIENNKVRIFSDVIGKNVSVETVTSKNIAINRLDVKEDLTIHGDIDLTSNIEQIININQGLVYRLNNREGAFFSVEDPLGNKVLHVTLRENVGIGTSNPEEKLQVLGKIKAESFITDTTEFPDYVFENNYDLMSINELKKFTQKNKHLPGMPSEKEVKEKGLDVKKVNLTTVEKLEELYLYIFQLEEKVKQATKKVNELEGKLTQCSK